MSWQAGEVLDDWEKDNMVPIFNKSRKEDPGSCCPLHLYAWVEVEQILLEAVPRHMAGG